MDGPGTTAQGDATLDTTQRTQRQALLQYSGTPRVPAGTEMGPSGRVALAAGLWLLYTLGEAEDPGVPAPRRCLLSHYRSLDPRALAAAKALKDRYDPSRCHEASVIFNLLRLLMRDLRIVAHSGPCV
ncbi:hypothetical protein TREES_T100012832 [Tupaia chinensis]|uniref:Uncharacterized protein n=1 Tax=Tupaia chinensis TaxID=246437 RepID=L9LBS8_TUPCH|nr:hypothetical protein TREES_T100012832 [Tupaia chinensis]